MQNTLKKNKLPDELLSALCLCSLWRGPKEAPKYWAGAPAPTSSQDSLKCMVLSFFWTGWLFCPFFSRSVLETQVQHAGLALQPHPAQPPFPDSSPSKPGVTALCLSPMGLKHRFTPRKENCNHQIGSHTWLSKEQTQKTSKSDQTSKSAFKPLQFLPAGSSRAHTLTLT